MDGNSPKSKSVKRSISRSTSSTSVGANSNSPKKAKNKTGSEFNICEEEDTAIVKEESIKRFNLSNFMI